MTNPPIKSPWLDYKPGDVDSKGDKIDDVFNCTGKFVIYKVARSFSFVTQFRRSECTEPDRALAIARALEHRAYLMLPKHKRSTARSLIIRSLALAFSSPKTLDEVNHFAEPELYIDNILSELSHFRYIATALISTIISAAVPFFYLQSRGGGDIYDVLVGSSFGSMGALVSVIQRFQSIRIPKYCTWRYTILRGSTRILLGAIFGALFLVFQKSGIVLSTLTGNIFLVLSFAFISGLSERLVPELADKMHESMVSKTP